MQKLGTMWVGLVTNKDSRKRSPSKRIWGGERTARNPSKRRPIIVYAREIPTGKKRGGGTEGSCAIDDGCFHAWGTKRRGDEKKRGGEWQKKTMQSRRNHGKLPTL